MLHQCCCRAVGLWFCALLATPQLAAEEVAVEVSESREVTVGQNRVVLLRVTYIVDFAGSDDAPETTWKSLVVTYLVERLDGKELSQPGADAASRGDELIGAGGVQVFAAGTRESALRLKPVDDLGPRRDRSTSRENYESYARHTLKPLKVTNEAGAVVLSEWWGGVELTTRDVDLKVKAGLFKGEENHSVTFKGVNLD